MQETPHSPTPGELPTVRQLNRATLIAAAVAGVLLVTSVMPAEYGVDPLGTGRLMGLTAMGEAKSHRAEAMADTAQTLVLDDAASAPVELGADAETVELMLAPGEGREVKAMTKAGGEFAYEWSTKDGVPIYWEFHGEEVGAVGNDYTSYEIATTTGEKGTFRAPFEGTHGWYWRNDGTAAVTIVARAQGDFAKFALVPKK
ncbi:hypothetical protein GCM10011349_33180 [Novosphingobium indicum]|uniref:Transmembrane anchor protein n=1 Tax=Novosphingobium indicum TaxID=462949 RepID=A0ABQ2JXN6_9SPHN|nr:hypothetical protein [Novosphingobium indicum]GGN55971.1 hypothetical protein GCM10011349_33180 [Novosphingobium indicum]